MHKPSELLEFLKAGGIHAKKALSQNFLIDGNIIRKIVAFSKVNRASQVIEIGPGPGALTIALLNTGAHVTAIEKDEAFASSLTRLQTTDHRLDVIHGDAMTFAYNALSDAKIVANLPYHITTPILGRIIPCFPCITDVTVMVQKEVADRFVGKVGTPDYSSLTIFLQFYADVSYGFTVSPNCFYPKPSVSSAVVHLKLKQPPLPQKEIPPFFKVVKMAFKQRRKMMRASLKELLPSKDVMRVLEQLGKSGTCRPEELSLHDFLSFYDGAKTFLHLQEGPGSLLFSND